MILELATAELGNRIRRAFGLRGRITTSVDETAFLSAHVADLDRAPWRTEGLSWMAQLVQPAVAGQNSYVEIGCPSAPSDVATIEGLTVNNQNAAAASFGLYAVVAASPVAGGGTTEIPPPTGSASVNTPVGIGGGSAVIGFQGFHRLTIPVGSSAVMVIPPIVIQPGIVWRVFSAAVNQDVSVAAHGRWWPRQGV